MAAHPPLARQPTVVSAGCCAISLGVERRPATGARDETVERADGLRSDAPWHDKDEPVPEWEEKLNRLLDSRAFAIASATFSAGSAVLDVGSDVLVALTYLNAGHTSWGVLSFVFIALGYIANCLYPFSAQYASGASMPIVGMCMSCCGLGPVFGILAVARANSDGNRSTASFWAGLAKATEGAMEAFPQTVLQSYVLLRSQTAAPGELEGVAFTPQQLNLQWASVGFSLFSLTAAAVFARTAVEDSVGREGAELSARFGATNGALLWLCTLGQVALRVATLCWAAVVFRAWLVSWVGLSFAVALAWFVKNHEFVDRFDGRDPDSKEYCNNGMNGLIGAFLSMLAPHINYLAAGWIFNTVWHGAESALVLLVVAAPFARPSEGGALMGTDRIVHGVCGGGEGLADACFPVAAYAGMVALWLVTYAAMVPYLTRTAVYNRRVAGPAWLHRGCGAFWGLCPRARVSVRCMDPVRHAARARVRGARGAADVVNLAGRWRRRARSKGSVAPADAGVALEDAAGT